MVKNLYTFHNNYENRVDFLAQPNYLFGVNFAEVVKLVYTLL